jgi:rSAM/selenodomain-associated transferase 1
MTDSVIVVMAKQPVVGKTKTRLCPPFSPEQAAKLFEALMRDTIHLTSQVPNTQTAVAISPPESESYFVDITPPNTLLLSVEGADIGECLAKSFEVLFQRGFKKVIAFNADGPTLPLDYLVKTLDYLDKNDVVLGLGDDGGYYLIGLKRLNWRLFQNINWSTDLVFEQTKSKVKQAGLSLAETPHWYDVDTFSDFERLVNDLKNLPETMLPFTRQYLSQADLPGL